MYQACFAVRQRSGTRLTRSDAGSSRRHAASDTVVAPPPGEAVPEPVSVGVIEAGDRAVRAHTRRRVDDEARQAPRPLDRALLRVDVLDPVERDAHRVAEEDPLTHEEV